MPLPCPSCFLTCRVSFEKSSLMQYQFLLVGYIYLKFSVYLYRWPFFASNPRWFKNVSMSNSCVSSHLLLSYPFSPSIHMLPSRSLSSLLSSHTFPSLFDFSLSRTQHFFQQLIFINVWRSIRTCLKSSISLQISINLLLLSVT